MDHPPDLSPDLSTHLNLPGMTHGFFGRLGGVSSGIFSTLNCGFGSDDDPQSVAENRRRAAGFLGYPQAQIATPHQVHGIDIVHVTHAWGPKAGPKADGVVTNRPGIVLGVLSADCAPILFADPVARIIGATHAGWRGALAGAAEATLTAMEALGAKRQDIIAAIGPCIGPKAYEVGLEFEAAHLAADAQALPFFRPHIRSDKRYFDLPGYLAHRLSRAQIRTVENLELCTYTHPDRFFSYRRTCQAAEPDYGRDLSAIALHD
jgi:YfiH family protein